MEIKSKIIKDVLKEVGVENIYFVKDMLSIERYVLNPPTQYSSGMHSSFLKSKYPDLYDAVLEELNPPLHKSEQQRQKEVEEYSFKRSLEMKKEEHILRAEVLECLGG